MNEVIKKQILSIRETGKTNMFDIPTVQYLANEMHYYELVIFLEESHEEYINFILYGDV